MMDRSELTEMLAQDFTDWWAQCCEQETLYPDIQGETMGDYVAGYVLHFKDGGPPEEQVLHRGSFESCRDLADLIPAVSYSGPRPIDRCEWVVVPEPEVGTQSVERSPSEGSAN